MKTIGITELGTLASADADLFSSTGELLISKGEAIPPERIDTLRARIIISETHERDNGEGYPDRHTERLTSIPQLGWIRGLCER